MTELVDVPLPMPGVELVEVAGGRQVLASVAGSMLGVSPTAAVVWQCLPEGGRIEELVADLAEAFDAPAGVVDADVRAFLDSLTDLELVVPTGDKASDPGGWHDPVDGESPVPVLLRSKPYYLDTAPNN